MTIKRDTYTRKQRMSNECSHEQYYAQFVTEEILELVRNGVGVKSLMVSKSREDSFNDIPIRVWDTLGNFINTPELHDKFKAQGDLISKSSLVCLLKQAGEEIVHEQELINAKKY